MAMAVQELFPGTQVTIGPVIENGFFYDFARKEPFTKDDLKKIEKKMSEIIDRDVKTKREVWDRGKAIAHFKKIGEKYKAEIIESIPTNEELSIYHHGDTWHDLCRGPHLVSSGKIGKAFKLTKVSGAYWRGDSNNEMLQRIYGTCWSSKKELDEYLHRLEEAEKRDHRKLGKEMDLFHFREESPGSVFWHEKGWNLFQRLVEYMRLKQRNAGYKEISTPELLDKSLWEKSGHWEKFGHHMFTSETPDEKVFAVKPMNCPGCVQVFNQGLKSYRDLPLKLSEFGKVHRYEPSGALHGLLRVRAFTQDDAHIFCTLDQIEEEVEKVINLTTKFLNTFGFKDYEIFVSTKPAKYVGSDSEWDQATKALKNSLVNKSLDFSIDEGGGAFYGPKIDLKIKDVLGRSWQCSTVQVDFNLPKRFDLNYISRNNDRLQPVMIHRAIFGSFERFFGILIEHYGGAFPFWLAPVQVKILTVSDEQFDYCDLLSETFKKSKIRVEFDKRNEKLGLKIREAAISKVPYVITIGKAEVENKTVTVRRLGSNKTSTVSFVEEIKGLIPDCEIPK